LLTFNCQISIDIPPGASSADTAGWSSEQLVAFLDKLHEYRSMTPLSSKVSEALAKTYSLYGHKNCEIK
jgi:leukotriene-A4 hydrolase